MTNPGLSLDEGALRTLELLVEAQYKVQRAQVRFSADWANGWLVASAIVTEDGVERKLDPPLVVAALTEEER